jgi:large repetitive protein
MGRPGIVLITAMCFGSLLLEAGRGPLAVAAPPAPPPDTTLVTAPSPRTNSQVGSFSFVSQLDVTFECRLDLSAWAACSGTPQTVGSQTLGSHTTASLGEGSHSLEVRAVDSGGNADPFPASVTWFIDLTSPATTITRLGDTPSNAVVDFELTSNEPGTFECNFDNTGFAPCPATLTTPILAEGNHTLLVRAIDLAGNVDPDPDSDAWTVDSLAPDTALSSTPLAFTSDATATFAFAASETPATFECSLDSAGYVPCNTPFTTNALASGIHTFSVRARDLADHVDPTPVAFTWMIDSGAPNTTIDSAPAGTTDDQTGDFAFSSSEGGSTFECRLDGGAFVTCTSPFASVALADGSHAFDVRAVDAAGNVDASPATHTWIVDSVDADGDGVYSTDNCPLYANADQADEDGDGTGDECEAVDPADGGGCGCRSSSSGTGIVWFGVLGVIILRRRRSRRS